MSFLVDTNLFVYAVDASAGPKQARAREVLARLWKERSGRASFQVLHEYYVVTTRKLAVDVGDLRATIRALLAWQPVVHDAVLLDRTWELLDRYSLSFWDAAVIAAAIEANCSHVLTEDMQHGQDFAGISVLNPFGASTGLV